MNLSFIGVGVMGNPMCANLIKSGEFEVSVYDIDPARIDSLEALGARRMASTIDGIGRSNLVMTSLPGPAQVSSVAFGESGILGNMASGATWIDFSTNNLAVCAQIASESLKAGIGYLDSPVSGGDEGATAGTLTILVGGEETVFKKCLPVLEIIGDNITHLGSNGAGYSAKIAQVLLCYLHSLALSEALMLGIKGGVNADAMLDIIQNSTGKSYVADRYGPPILDGDYDASFTVGLAHKDMKLAMEMANNLGIKLPLCEMTTDTYARAIEVYGFDANHLKAVRLLEEENETFLRSQTAK